VAEFVLGKRRILEIYLNVVECHSLKNSHGGQEGWMAANRK
jgi:hypothetical protein